MLGAGYMAPALEDQRQTQTTNLTVVQCNTDQDWGPIND